ncbi:hypothetical protein VFSR5_2728 [Aliivibrio fischeri SR5]|uniref:Uncharacterized protein n=1 Tax=Aliivibrio fischeri SR5 TaxID=1088719 RepID=A0AAV3EMC0_ALIFS|nr:hypothetical protein VFSR5_2721 [Aliivibrio fischeri SR5]EHN68003.1 hypothetical protein VFSR5_2728 [Aliivibrio fischeri SR5]
MLIALLHDLCQRFVLIGKELIYQDLLLNDFN